MTMAPQFKNTRKKQQTDTAYTCNVAARYNVSFLVILFSIVIALGSCGRNRAAIDISRIPTLDHIVERKPIDGSDHKIRFPFVIRNLSQASGKFRVDEQSCSCFGMVFEKVPIAVGDELEIKSGQSGIFEFLIEGRGAGSVSPECLISVSVPGFTTERHRLKGQLTIHQPLRLGSNVVFIDAVQNSLVEVEVFVCRQLEDIGVLDCSIMSPFIRKDHELKKLTSILIGENVVQEKWALKLNRQANFKAEEAVHTANSQIGQVRINWRNGQNENWESTLSIRLRQSDTLSFPKHITLSPQNSNGRSSLKFPIRRTGGKPFRVISVSCSSQEYFVHVLSEIEGNVQWISVEKVTSALSQEEHGPISANVTLHISTDLENFEQIELQVR